MISNNKNKEKPIYRFKWKWREHKKERTRQFIRRIILFFTITVISIIAGLLYSNRQLRMNFYETTIENNKYLSFLTFEKYFIPLSDFITLSSFWIEMGNISDLGNPDLYIDRLRELLSRFRLVEEAFITDLSGNTLQINGENLDQWNFTKQHDKSAPIRGESETLEDFHDLPHNFQLSPLHFWKKSGKTGFTITLNFLNSSHTPAIQMKLYINLEKVVEALSKLPEDKNTHFFIMLDQNDYIVFQLTEILNYLTGNNDDINLESVVTEDQSDLLNEAINNWPALENNKRNKVDYISYQFSEKDWVLTFREIDLGYDSFTIGTIVPLETLFLERFKLLIILIIPFIIIVSLALLAFLIFDYFIFKKSEIISEQDILMNLIKAGESASLEFKSSLRWDYRENKVNKHLEEVILKSIAAFNNSQGGELLIGVNDEGNILGLEPDYQSLKDPDKDYFELHLRNLISTMYGIEFAAKNLEITFPLIKDKEICSIKIAQGHEPLYTIITSKNGEKKEQFFIRSGNSSRRIESMKEASNYIIGHFK
ncbi:MAG: ATP-binding protein [Spirochaetes bacterium]|nr:ATP-binding protein [Spirochaetota bacterium]